MRNIKLKILYWLAKIIRTAIITVETKIGVEHSKILVERLQCMDNSKGGRSPEFSRIRPLDISESCLESPITGQNWSSQKPLNAKALFSAMSTILENEPNEK